jgi:bifunctional UDP-N-acetylglucosamine pyrophosphorylase/glucosamine-1-phosphate N-acetyltransferase
VKSDEPPIQSTSVAAVILAAGLGTRMRSKTPKELHPIAGRPMLHYVLDAAQSICPDQVIVVLSPAKAALAGSLPNGCEVAWQLDPLGTGHAATQALALLKPEVTHVAILFGDHPLLTADAVAGLVERASNSGSLVTLLTAVLEDPGAYGRLRHHDGRILGVVEAKEDTQVHTEPVEINSGISCYDRTWLEQTLPNVARSSLGEYYLTSLVELAASSDWSEQPVVSLVTSPDVAYGVNDRVDLANAERLMRRRINERLMRSGVSIVDPGSTFIDDGVHIERDTRIEPFTIIKGETQIGEGSVIGPHATIDGSSVGRTCAIVASTLESSVVGDRVHVGPYSHFRFGTRVDSDVHIGNYVEIKNSHVSSGTHIGHFSYVGDAEIGRNVNIAAGTITANYDGVDKHRTIIEDNAFIGCDTILRAPVTVGNAGRTGAGSVVTRNVPPGATVVGMPARPIASKAGPEWHKREETDR